MPTGPRTTINDTRHEPVGLRERIGTIRAALEASDSLIPISGNAAFLACGRVLCRPQRIGDSRYPYGGGGFTFWANASGRMSANRGPFFWLLPTDEGQDPPIGAFVGSQHATGTGFQSHSVLPTPGAPPEVEDSLTRYTVLGHDAAYYFVESDRLLAVLRVFVDQDSNGRPTLYFSLCAENRGSTPSDVFTSFYLNPFCRHQFAATAEDRWFKRVEIEQMSEPDRGAARSGSRDGLRPFTIQSNEDVSRFESISNWSIVQRCVDLRTEPAATTAASKRHGERLRFDPGRRLVSQATTSFREYVGGATRGLANAAFLSTGRLAETTVLTTFKENAVVADLQRTTLAPGGWLRCDYAWSEATSAGADTANGISGRIVDRAAERVAARKSNHAGSRLTVRGESRINAPAFNHFATYLQKQVAVCAQLRGYMQVSPNSLIGFRDVLQALEGRLLDHPDEARDGILEALEYVLPDGRCPRQYLPSTDGQPAIGDLREFVDQGSWAISAVTSYVQATGDLSFLSELAGYHRVSPTDDRLLFPAGEHDSVLDHLVRIIDYLSSKRDPESGLVFALYGDWNDAIDGLGVAQDRREEFGSGVSVMASLHLHKNYEELLELLALLSPSPRADLADRFRAEREQLGRSLRRHAVVHCGGERRILHGWGDRRSFYVGGFEDADGLSRDALTSNAFWGLSSVYDEDPSIKADLLAALRRLDSRYGYKTFEPGFGPDASMVGRINKLPIGAAENGAAYLHATAFAIAALFRIGEARLAWEQIGKILPFAEHHKNLSHSPFVMPNSYLENPALNLDGQSMNDWQSGSSNVLWKTLVRYAAGYKPSTRGLLVAPASWSPFPELTFQIRAYGADVSVTRIRGATEGRRFELNGSEWRQTEHDCPAGIVAARIPWQTLRNRPENRIVVIDPQDDPETRPDPAGRQPVEESPS